MRRRLDQYHELVGWERKMKREVSLRDLDMGQTKHVGQIRATVQC
jgi:hypothetical protein